MRIKLIIKKSNSEPIQIHDDYDDRWGCLQAGILTSWNRGRQLIRERPDLAKAASNGRLIPLAWKGGVEKKLKKDTKYGSLYYLAMWQGLRGNDLNIDTEIELPIKCSATEMTVIFTSDSGKFIEP